MYTITYTTQTHSVRRAVCARRLLCGTLSEQQQQQQKKESRGQIAATQTDSSTKLAPLFFSLFLPPFTPNRNSSRSCLRLHMCVMASFKEKANERKEGEEEEKKKKFPKKGELALASSTKGTPTVSLSLSVFSIYLQTKDKRASSSFGAMPEREGEIFSFEASDDANRGRRSKTSSFSYSSTDGRAGAAGSMKPIERSFAFFFAVEIGWLDTLY